MNIDLTDKNLTKVEKEEIEKLLKREKQGLDDFEESIIQETYRIQDNWGWPYHYIQTGFYYNQVKAYLNNFKNVKVFLYEDLKDMNCFMQNIFDFLSLNKIELENNNEVYNKSGYPKSKLIHKFVNNNFFLKDLIKPIAKKLLPKDIMSKIKNNNLTKVNLSSKTRIYLNGIYGNDIEQLSNIINRDLKIWTKNEM